ncbi:hypothetical protein [Cyanobacterium sp. Dongsha4]|uniref:arginine synthesis PII-interacting regulator PirA n=1 Tax=Cyanobacterium sp. DS4 TaxID=2878255 RepID=UPI002E8089C1|nr:hypothetical protein [Cyanobacterium sp. Dongsha4]WVK99475.1 hypothetical protein Dongsha4_12385 [Cyanobacterium sp. Dongsha4]
MISQKTLENARQAHRTNLIKSLEHRIEVAKAKGQTALVEQLEAEKLYYLK